MAESRTVDRRHIRRRVDTLPMKLITVVYVDYSFHACSMDTNGEDEQYRGKPQKWPITGFRQSHNEHAVRRMAPVSRHFFPARFVRARKQP